MFNAAFDKVIERYTSNHQQLSDQVWGIHNQLSIKHPISQAVPVLGVFLDRKPYPMAGDTHSPRVQTPRFGASQRMVIAPGVQFFICQEANLVTLSRRFMKQVLMTGSKAR